ncbi:MAG: helix-turn-helix domain-containing protein [Burkholderiales bacterium]|nr:helix-turn-helix domain-containing protein [Burkholderiales bacterium]
MLTLEEQLRGRRRRLARGDLLFDFGAPVEQLFAVWSGFFKTGARIGSGPTQVSGFYMSGEVIGLGAVGMPCHSVRAEALEDATVFALSLPALEDLGQKSRPVQRLFHRLLGGEINRKQGTMLLLGNRSADSRLAAFLLDLSARSRARGFSPSAIVLHMSRTDIASYLGLSLETVSRTLTKMQSEGLLFVQGRQVRITDPLGLENVDAPRSAFGAPPTGGRRWRTGEAGSAASA